METVMLGAGVCLLIGAAAFAWMTVTLRRNGKPWRGAALLAGATMLYAGVALSGDFTPPTAVGAVLVAIVALLMWAGVIVMLRDRRKAEAGGQG